MGKWSWSCGGWTKRSRGRSRRTQRAHGRRRTLQPNRRLLLESLEPRQLLSGGPPLDATIAAWLAAETPHPQPTGDRPSDTARLVTLSAYTPEAIIDPGIPELEPYIDGERQIYSNILSNPAARPSYWGEPAAAGGNQYRLYLCDNGMLVSGWTVNWGDGSNPQQVTNQPWVIHSYTGSPSPYAISVTAFSVDGKFTVGMGATPGALDQDFNAGSGPTADWASRGPSPDWATQLGDQGQQATNFEGNGGFDQASAEALDNGHILVVGTTAGSQFGLVRYTDQPGLQNDGELDTTFGSGGLVTTTFAAGNASASAVAVDAGNSTIVVAGIVVDSNSHNELALARYNDADGSLDTTFGTGGLVTTDLGTGWSSTKAVVVESDHSILVAGTMSGHFALLHYASNGTQDTSFGGATGGIVTTSFGGTSDTPSAMALDSTGRILVAGTSTQTATGEDFALARYSSSGTLDTTFGSGGLVTTDFAGGDDEATSLAIQSNGKIILAGRSDQGSSHYTFALARYNTSGSLDANFGSAGLVTTDFGDGDDCATGVAIQGNGQIVVSGTTLLDGSGNIGSQTHFALARYNSDGSADATFGSGGTVTTDFSTLGFDTENSAGIMVDANGRLVVAGTASQSTYSSFAVSCYDPGSSSLSIQTQYDPPVLRMVVPDQVIAAGQALNLSPLGMFACQPGATSFSYAIDWGDGSTPDTGTITDIQGGGSAFLTGSFGDGHTYAAPGVYDVAATVACSQGADTQTIQVTVNSTLAFETTSIPTTAVNVGQTYNLPTITFTDPSLLDTHTATIDWGDGTTDNPPVTEPSFDDTQLTPVPGSFTDSYTYSASGTYNGTITLTDEGGATITESFTVNVLAADVALTDFATDGHLLQVTYSVSDATSAPFQIGIYSSPDGTTPDQLLGSYAVGAIDSGELTVGSHTVSIAPPAADVSGDYYLIAVADSDATPEDNTIAFDGGIFRGNDSTMYVFGTDAADTAQVQTASLALNSTSYLLASTPAAVHVRTEGGDDTVTVDQGVTEPLWIYGGSGNNTITDDGSGGDLLDDGGGQSVVHGGYGFNSPEIVDDSDPQTPVSGATAYYQQTGSSSPVASGFNDGEQELATGSQATWTFANLGPSGYYDVYVTWSPQAGAADNAQFVVMNGSTAIYPVLQSEIATVDQTKAPADYQSAGVFWHDLGIFQVSSGTLNVQLSAGSTPVLADAVQLVSEGTTAPTTNLAMSTNGFTVDNTGNLSVTYTVADGVAPSFSIGIYSSPDGVQPVDLLQTYEIDDPGLLSVGEHTVSFAADFSGSLPDIDHYLLAQLDANDEVYETTKADNLSGPLAGATFQDSSGDLYILPGDSNGQTVSITQDAATGDVSVGGTAYENVGTVYITLAGSSNFVSIDSSVTASVVIYGSAGGDTITDNGSGDDTIHGGAGFNTITVNGNGNATIYGGNGGNLIYGGSGCNTIYAGSGNDTIYGGSGDNEIYGGAGTDILDGSAGQNNWIQGGSGPTTIDGGAGSDWLYAGSGPTVIAGGNGTEVIHGGSGCDYLNGGFGPGYDDIYSGTGTSYLYGNGPHDYFHLEGGTPHVYPEGSGLANYEVQDLGGMSDSGSYNGDYEAIDAGGGAHSMAVGGGIAAATSAGPDVVGGGGGVADWEFDNIYSDNRLGENTVTACAVYVTWDPNASPDGGHWTDDASYKVYDGTAASGTLLDTVSVDQTSAPTNSLTFNGSTFQLLGVYNFTGTATVELCDPNPATGDMLNADAVVLHALWPVVTIRADLDGTGQFGEKDDFLAACNGVDIPVEGSGSRTQLHLTAAVDALFAQAPAWTGAGPGAWNWSAALPTIAGVDFWNDSQSTTPWQGQGLAIVAGTTFTSEVWVSTDPDSPSTSPFSVVFKAYAPPGVGDADTTKDVQLDPDAVLQGGQDITAALTMGLDVFDHLLRGLNPTQFNDMFNRFTPAGTVRNGELGFWNIIQLAGAGKEVGGNSTTFNETIGHKLPDRDGTVTVHGKVYWAAEIDYVLWGNMWRVAYDRGYLTEAFYGGPMSKASYFSQNVSVPLKVWRLAAYGRRIRERDLPLLRSPGVGAGGRTLCAKAGFYDDYKLAAPITLNAPVPGEPRSCVPGTQLYKGPLTFVAGGVSVTIRLTKTGWQGYKYKIDACQLPGVSAGKARQTAEAILRNFDTLDSSP